MRAAVLISTSSASARDATVPCPVRTGWNGGAGSISGPVNGMALISPGNRMAYCWVRSAPGYSVATMPSLGRLSSDGARTAPSRIRTSSPGLYARFCLPLASSTGAQSCTPSPWRRPAPTLAMLVRTD